MGNFIRRCGYALLIGGLLVVLTNAILTPLLPTELGDASTRTSAVYLARFSASGTAALLLQAGCLGLYLAQKGGSGAFGTFAFIVAFLGNSLLVAVEWANVFVLRAIAQVNPATLAALDESPLMNGGFASGAGIFALGWLLLSIALLRARILPRWAPLLVLAGLILIPTLTATPLGLAGAIIGNVVFGLGLGGSGYFLSRLQE